MFIGTDLKIQFACAFVIFILWFLCLIPVRYAQKRADSGYNNSNPREQYNSLPGYAQRAASAHTNLMEGFVWFGFSILANIIGNGHLKAVSILSLIYTASRVIYIPLYLFDIHMARSLIWTIGLLANFGIFIVPFATANSSFTNIEDFTI